MQCNLIQVFIFYIYLYNKQKTSKKQERKEYIISSHKQMHQNNNSLLQEEKPQQQSSKQSNQSDQIKKEQRNSQAYDDEKNTFIIDQVVFQTKQDLKNNVSFRKRLFAQFMKEYCSTRNDNQSREAIMRQSLYKYQDKYYQKQKQQDHFALQMVKIKHFKYLKQVKQPSFNTFRSQNIKEIFEPQQDLNPSLLSQNYGLNKVYKNMKNVQNQIQQYLWKINFTNLKWLIIQSLNLESIQFLSYLSFPNLQACRIVKNKISRINSLSKCTFKNLLELSLNNNRLNLQIYSTRSYFTKLKKFTVNPKSVLQNSDLHFDYHQLDFPSLQLVAQIPKILKLQNYHVLQKLFMYNQDQMDKANKLIKKLHEVNRQGIHVRKLLPVANFVLVDGNYVVNYDQMMYF